MGRAEAGSGVGAGIADELRQTLAGQQFSSLEEAQALAERLMRRRNQTPLDEFCGLSPEQMYRLLNFPFDTPSLVDFPSRLEAAPAAPILTLFGLLADAIGGAGLKPTARGNLPQKFCREAALRYWGEEGFREQIRFGGINKEEDFYELHCTRLVAELAGLVRKHKGRFILSRECRGLLADGGLAAIYPRLLHAYAVEFNWAYGDGYPEELRFIQQSFVFTLYLLDRYGDEPRPQDFHEELFIRAFPAVVAEVEPGPYRDPPEEVRACYTLRALIRFAGFLGLAAVTEVEGERRHHHNYRIAKLPLLAEAVRFHLSE